VYPKIVSAVLFLFLFLHLHAQEIDNTSTFKTTGSNHYFRFHYDNDYFTKSDEYYTQGINFEFANPRLKKFIVYRLLVKPMQPHALYGIALDSYGYTPTTILSDSILYNDRPFCSNLSLKFFTTAVTANKRITTALSAGVMGQAGGGQQIQSTIHKWLANPQPHGWEFQIKNDVILNYQLQIEHRLVTAGSAFELSSMANVQLGTHDVKAGAGFNFMAGHFTSAYSEAAQKKFTVYVYAQPQVIAVGYNATLQGGLFNRNSPYTIAAKNINRILFRGDYGITLRFKKIYLEYCQSLLTKEFTTGALHRWGGVRVGVLL
jgi:lipid A 3-O-deacylase